MKVILQNDKKSHRQSGADSNREAVQLFLRICASAAFTLIELLVVIAIIGLLASLLFPVLSRAKTSAQGIGCVNNLKQFALAWLMYTIDNNDRIPPNNPMDHPESGPVSNTWVRGWIQLGDHRPDDTNTVFLTQSLLGSYLGRSIQVWRCPSDHSVSLQHGIELPRVRTVHELLAELRRRAELGPPGWVSCSEGTHNQAPRGYDFSESQRYVCFYRRTRRQH
jgi:prepilin-type N-terminal cleavage/methylation domain-containing protein